MARALFVGLMSGTSLDGVDAVLADLSEGSAVAPRLLGSHLFPYPEAVRAEALALNCAGADEIDRGARLANELSRVYANAVAALLQKCAVRPVEVIAIGCHGQTIRHRPEAGFTVQLVNGALLAELSDIQVVTDFRSRDIAAGGQGAPLVPAFHSALFRHRDIERVIVNIGGIANLTHLPRTGPVRGFDTGPGNCLLDEWATAHSGSGERFDRDGALAAGGVVVAPRLAAMLADPYFGLPAPKSTGRDHFNAAWLSRFIDSTLRPGDVQATLAALTAQSIANAIQRDCGVAQEVFVCGGGVHNHDLMQRLAAALPRRRIGSTAELGVDPDWVEAYAFAWLARCAVKGLPGNLASVTGAAGARVLGAIYPR